MNPGTDKTDLIGMDREALAAFFADLGEKPFRARQLMAWIHQRRELDFTAMTDMSKRLRETLASRCRAELPTVLREERSRDGTVKWLLGAGATQAIETVFIPEPDRGTLCVSSQVGCALDCAFCSTAQQGFNRNLTAAEIVAQVLWANAALPPRGNDERAVSNVVLMGMGEPLANYRAVVPALRILLDDHAYGLSRRRITLSTSGLVPQLKRLADECNVALAVSLHAPNDALRNELVPINRIHPIAELLETCWYYASRFSNRHITFEYVMLDGVNDQPAHARQLAKLLRGKPAKLNLIPFNPFPGTEFRCSPRDAIDRFAGIVRAGGCLATIRKTRGDDIDAACGQLAGQVNDRVRVRLGAKPIRAAEV
ncbi:MAG: 23S rRNA (adenine(2503)-C(2))-methyltransferase RlmN [Pseudomonadota bacterium]